MYETPKLNYVGEARDVVLGIPALGWDFDCTQMIWEREFEEDPEAGN
jgi:hypothetical protein